MVMPGVEAAAGRATAHVNRAAQTATRVVSLRHGMRLRPRGGSSHSLSVMGFLPSLLTPCGARHYRHGNSVAKSGATFPYEVAASEGIGRMARIVGRFGRAGAVCLTGAMLLGACSTTSGSSTGSGKPLTIGISMSLSGDFADFADPAKKGYELWAATVNAKGGLHGRKVVLKIADDASNPTQVVTNYQNLITASHVDLGFGPFSTLLTIPAATIASRFGYAFIEPSGGGPAVFALHLHDLFLAQPAPALSSGDAFADYILSLPAAPRPRTAAYPSADDPFTSPIVGRVRPRLEAAGIKTG